MYIFTYSYRNLNDAFPTVSTAASYIEHNVIILLKVLMFKFHKAFVR